MNRRDFLAQGLKLLAVSPLLVGSEAVKIISEKTIADKVRFEKPPPIESPEDKASPWFAPRISRFILIGEADEEFGISFDIRDGMLYLWQ